MNLNVGDIVQYVDKFSDAYMVCSEFEPRCAILIGEVVELEDGEIVIQELIWNNRGGRYISHLSGVTAIDLKTVNVIGTRNENLIK